VSGRPAAIAGIALGLAAVAGLWIIASSGRAEPPQLSAGTALLTFLYAAPFVAALGALRVRAPSLRGGLWAGSGIVAVVLPVATFSFAGMLIVPGGIALIVAAALARPHGARGFVVALAAVIVTATAAVGASTILRKDACWTRTPDGWIEQPGGSTAAYIANASNFPFERVCGSSVTGAGTAVAIGAWAVFAAAIALGARRREVTPA
jgi:MYXO-CTERM domain-containing protein